MEKIRRKFFFWILVIIFFIVAPAIILNARGYRFDSSRGVFVYSGTITIKSNPQTVDISLNGKPAAGLVSRINNSHNLTGLLPGDYEIKASLPGYRLWTKKIDVHSGVASEFWNVMLVRENYEKVSYDDAAGIDRFYISPKNKFIAYSKNNDGLRIGILDIGSKVTQSEFPIDGWNLIADEKKENIEWSPNEDYISVPVEKEITEDESTKTKPAVEIASPARTQYAYFIINPTEKDIFNLNEFLGKDSIQDVRWDPKNKNYLFFLEGQSLWRANITNKDDLTLISENVAGYDLSNSGVYWIQAPNNLVIRADFDGGSKSQITNNFPGFTDVPVTKIIIYDETRIGLINANRDLFVYNEGDRDTYFRKIGNNVESLAFSDDGKKMLFWNNNEIFVYFVRDWDVQPTRTENELDSITRYSEKIENIQWSKDYEHVIFNTGQWVKVTELDGRDRRNCMDLIRTEVGDSYIRYNNSLEYLFLTDKSGDTTSLQSIVFPEPTPILGIGG
jgi:hypothetical protein